MTSSATISPLNSGVGCFIHSALDEYGLTPSQFRVFCHIVRRAWKNACYEQVMNAAAMCKMNHKTYREAVKFLERNGFITVHRRAGRSNQITLNDISQWAKPMQDTSLPESDHTPPQRGNTPLPEEDHKGIPHKAIPLSYSPKDLEKNARENVFSQDDPTHLERDRSTADKSHIPNQPIAENEDCRPDPDMPPPREMKIKNWRMFKPKHCLRFFNYVVSVHVASFPNKSLNPKKAALTYIRNSGWSLYPEYLAWLDKSTSQPNRSQFDQMIEEADRRDRDSLKAAARMYREAVP